MSEKIVNIKTTVDQASYIKKLVAADRERIEREFLALEGAEPSQALKDDISANDGLRMQL